MTSCAMEGEQSPGEHFKERGKVAPLHLLCLLSRSSPYLSCKDALHEEHGHAMCREVVFGHSYSFMRYNLYKSNIISSPAPLSVGTLAKTEILQITEEISVFSETHYDRR